ncbi:NLR family CARD domain-containing protein 4-like [Apostichopus japonicus]|uniref:NLR family CARD domain-containing protein 4-like n=1 Tax=Stichopus japonicus TaxID=307972 RepID=UPI003AB3DED5
MAQAGPSQSTGRDTGTNPAEGFGLFKVDLAGHLNVTTIKQLSTLLGLNPGEIDMIKGSQTPGLEMVNLLDERGIITPTDIRDLLKMLRKLKLAGVAGRIQSSFQAKTYRANRDQDLDLEEKKRDFIKYSKTAYRTYYETAKPFPSIGKYSVNSIFVEGGIYYLAQEGDSMQKPDVLEPLESYNDILSSPKTKSNRKIIEADPGYGKSTLASQFVYDWCTNNPESPLKDVEILIFLQLRQLEGVKSIYTAIKNSIVPEDEDMDEACIKEILKAYRKSVVMLFDSYDEYPDKKTKTDIFSIIEMKMFQDILVIILTRTLNLPPNLHPETKRIRLTGFGVAERRNYVLKALADDVQLADRIEIQLQRNPFLRDLYQVPLFSTMVAHIAHKWPEIEIFSTVTRFFTYVIACVHNHMKIKKDASTGVPAFETELAKLYRIAFDGLTQKNQQLAWENTYLVSELGQEFYDNYIKLGMLAQEVVFDISLCRYKTVARIWHKIICEFYASHHLVWILSEGASSVASSINVKETLNSINPLDHQYVYRFACGLNKSAADIIIKHLQETEEGRQFAILCMLEQEEKSDQFMQSVKDLVSITINIFSFHAKLLQGSTIQVLEVASAKQIPISCVYLGGCSPRVDESGLNLILESGLSLSILSSLQKLMIFDNNRRLTNEELAAILSYSSQCTSLKVLWFVAYDLQDTIPVGSIPSSLKSRNVKVWNFIEYGLYSRLNLQTGQWQACDNRGNLPGEEGFDAGMVYQWSLANFNQEKPK